MKKLALLFLMLSGCSLIKINEAPQPPKSRPAFIGVTQLDNDREIQVRVRVSDIDQYWQNKEGTCTISIPHENLTTTTDCSELDALLNQRD